MTKLEKFWLGLMIFSAVGILIESGDFFIDLAGLAAFLTGWIMFVSENRGNDDR